MTKKFEGESSLTVELNMTEMKPEKCSINFEDYPLENNEDGVNLELEVDEKEEENDSQSKLRLYLSTAWNSTLGKIQEDWFFLALLGIIMAWVSLFVDYGIGLCIKSRLFLYHDLTTHPILRYLAWIWLPVCLILFSIGFTKLLAPQAAGSGIPETKTILRGILIKNHFSFKALIVKIIGLTTTLGTGLPLGKEGPFVHIASMAAILLSKATASFKGMYENKSRHSEMLAAACAVGVATAFATPIGGVLFSIEVTAVHFAVRNYWRGFFAAVCATVMNRLLAVWFKDEETLTALFRTNFEAAFPYAPQELFAFALIGVLCGFLGALFVWVHRRYVMFKGRNRIMKFISNKNIFFYPFLVTLLYTSLTFPLGLGMFVASDINTHKQVTELFSNFSWTKDDPSPHEFNIIRDWMSPYSGIFPNLFIYFVFTFFGTILACTMGVPGGIFVPVFKAGAAFGRIVGEAMALIFPNGISLGKVNPSILPGGYALVGAAALTGSVTHTVSSSVIAFEMTGQLGFCIPVMVAVLIANGVAQALQPSIFDSIIKMKKFPFLPNIASTQSKAHYVFVEEFMIHDVKFMFHGMTFRQLKETLVDNFKLRNFPVVDSKGSMILLGSASRKDLQQLLEDHLSVKRKKYYFYDWKVAAERSLGLDTMFLEGDGSIERSPEIEDLTKMKATPENHISNTFTTSATDLSQSPQLSDTAKPPKPLEKELLLEPERVRKLSRFSVTKIEGPLPPEPVKADDLELQSEVDMPSPNGAALTSGTLPKGILKKRNDFSYECNKSHYATIHGGDASRGFKLPFGNWRAKNLLRTDSKTSSRITFTLSGSSRNSLYKDKLEERIRQEEIKWEEKELNKFVDFKQCKINPAPLQLVESTNLLQVHSMFSLLGLSHAYVTAIGRLIGVVTISQLRIVIEDTNTEKIRHTFSGIHGKDFKKVKQKSKSRSSKKVFSPILEIK